MRQGDLQRNVKRTRVPRRIRIAAGVAAAVALAAVIFGLHRASVAQGVPAAISLDAPVSFPVDI